MNSAIDNCAVWKVHHAVRHAHFGLCHAKQVGGHLAELLVDVLARANDGGAHEHRRAARRCLQVEGHHGSISHHHRHFFQRRAERVGRELSENRPRPLAHVRRSGIDDDAAVGEQPHGRV